MASTTLTEPLPWINSIMLTGDQDRSRWDRGLIAEGQAIVRQCLRGNQPGPYQVQAAINTVHTDAPTAAATDRPQILRLYDRAGNAAERDFLQHNRQALTQI